MPTADSLDRLVQYELSVHPDALTTSTLIDALSSGQLAHFKGFSDAGSDQSGITDEQPIVYGGTTQFTHEGKSSTVMIVAQNNALLQPKSLMFANELYHQAEINKQDLLLITNTEGGAAGTGAALLGQSQLVSRNIYDLLNLKTSIASLVLRKGGSGGGLSNQVADVQLMMEFANYYVISPPHASSILWRSPDKVGEAVELLQPTSGDLLEAGIIDKIIEEYPGGAHREADMGYQQTLANIDEVLAEVFLEFNKFRKNPVRRFSTVVKRRHDRAHSYGAVESKYQSLKKRLSNIHVSLPSGKQKFHVASADELQNTLGDMVSYVHFERFKASRAKFGSSDEQYVDCGTINAATRKPGYVVEVNAAAIAQLDAKRQQEDLTHQEYMRALSSILINSSIAECIEKIPLDTFKENAYSCPTCGWGPTLPALSWISLLSDNDSFEEFNSTLDVSNLAQTPYHTKAYLQEIEEAKEKAGVSSALVTGAGTINGQLFTLAAMDFYFIGGTLGTVEAIKFQKAAEYAKKHDQPLVAITSSGGARMQEGTLALKMMESTNATVSYMKQQGIPYMVILANPTFGGTPASFGSLGDVTLAEKGLAYGFAGRRVIELAGGAIERFAESPQVLQYVETTPHRPLIDGVIARKDMKQTLSNYIRVAHAAK